VCVALAVTQTEGRHPATFMAGVTPAAVSVGSCTSEMWAPLGYMGFRLTQERMPYAMGPSLEQRVRDLDEKSSSNCESDKLIPTEDVRTRPGLLFQRVAKSGRWGLQLASGSAQRCQRRFFAVCRLPSACLSRAAVCWRTTTRSGIHA
jgi:hypothetical protein